MDGMNNTLHLVALLLISLGTFPPIAWLPSALSLVVVYSAGEGDVVPSDKDLSCGKS
jgi:hypothetical protein